MVRDRSEVAADLSARDTATGRAGRSAGTAGTFSTAPPSPNPRGADYQPVEKAVSAVRSGLETAGRSTPIDEFDRCTGSELNIAAAGTQGASGAYCPECGFLIRTYTDPLNVRLVEHDIYGRQP